MGSGRADQAPSRPSRFSRAWTAGEPLPRILAPGPKLDGGSFLESLFNWSRGEQRVLSTPADAHRAVAALKAQGVDFIKVHNHLSPALYEALVEESRQQQLPFAGHLPEAGPLTAAAAGQRTIEHGRGMLLCSADVWAEARTEPNARTARTYCAPESVASTLLPALVRAGT